MGKFGRKYRYKEVVLDVTGSAPSDEKPGKLLGSVLDEVIKCAGLRTRAPIVDFGAGKLRNAHYLMKKNFLVHAVEFKELAGKTPQAKRLWEAARKLGEKFKPIIFPHEFVGKHRNEYTLALIINTLSVMPVPAERLLVLAYLHSSLRKDGHVLWYAMKGDEEQTSRCHDSARLGDGYYTGEGKKYKQFWREYNVDEVDEMMQATGFHYVQSFDTQGNSQARLYQRDTFCPLEPVLTEEFVASQRPNDDKNILPPTSVDPRTFDSPHELDEIVPNPPELGLDTLCIEGLGRLEPVRRDDHRFHRLVALIFRRLFYPELSNQKLEAEVGTGRPDIIMSNRAEKGFFKTARTSYKIYCPLIFIECKNYGNEAGNPEVAQLLQRMNPKRGCLGFLVCRKFRNRDAMIARCRDAVGAKNYILALEDKDLIELLKLHRKDDPVEAMESIHNWLDNRVQELVL